jgi:flagellar basal body-associated protein FliL
LKNANRKATLLNRIARSALVTAEAEVKRVQELRQAGRADVTELAEPASRLEILREILRTEEEGETAEQVMAKVSLGDFSFSNTTATPGSLMHVDFKVAVMTPSKQASTLEELVKVNTGRIRAALEKIIRGASLAELNDPSLETIKRLIRDDINRLLRKTYVETVVITDVRISEQ